MEDFSQLWGWPVYAVRPDSKVFGYVILMGYSVAESTGGAAAELDLYDGQDATGLLALPIPLGAGQGTEDWFGPQGVHFRIGVFPVVASGAVKGSLWIAQPIG